MSRTGSFGATCLAALVVVAWLSFAAGCSSEGSDGQAAVVDDAGEPWSDGQAELIESFQRYTASAEEALTSADSDLDLFDAVATPAVADRAKENVTSRRADGLVGEGTIGFNPIIVEDEADPPFMHACVGDTIIEGPNGEPIDPVVLRIDFEAAAGGWLVADIAFVETDGAPQVCDPPGL